MTLTCKELLCLRSSLLCLNLLKFFDSFMHYLTFEVAISYPLAKSVFHSLSRYFHVAKALSHRMLSFLHILLFINKTQVPLQISFKSGAKMLDREI